MPPRQRRRRPASQRIVPGDASSSPAKVSVKTRLCGSRSWRRMPKNADSICSTSRCVPAWCFIEAEERHPPAAPASGSARTDAASPIDGRVSRPIPPSRARSPRTLAMSELVSHDLLGAAATASRRRCRRGERHGRPETPAAPGLPAGKRSTRASRTAVCELDGRAVAHRTERPDRSSARRGTPRSSPLSPSVHVIAMSSAPWSSEPPVSPIRPAWPGSRLWRSR